jgi:N-acyl-D-aspartate/D-glutamate deacylase
VAYDLVIRDGTVIDGSGLPRVRADVGVKDGCIAAVGRIRQKGNQEIDAEGHVVTPGFIDGHTHMDAQVFWDPYGTSSCWHGITTVVMGHCGFTLAPAREHERALVVRNLERAEDIPPEALAAGIDWSWETFAEYLTAVDRAPKAMNYAANIGHSALRTWAMGERAFEEPATEDDLDRMEGELLSALRAGAMGLSTSRSYSHETSDDRPVASRLADWSEVRRLVCAMGEAGPGIFQISKEPAADSPEPDIRRDWLDRMRQLAVESRATFSTHVSPSARADEDLQWVDSIADQGGRIFGLSHSRGVSVVFSFETRSPFDKLPEWKEVRSRPIEEQKRLFRDPEIRERLVRAANKGQYGRAIGTEVRPPDYELIQVWQQPIPPNPTVAEMASSRNVDPVELMIDLALASDFKQFFFQPLRDYEDDLLLKVMKHPRMVMTFSDAGAHVSQLADCSIQTHLLAYWTRKREEFTLEEAVRMLTLAPATAWGFADRGLVREGFMADLNVFDPDTVGPELPTLVHDLPAGAKRIIQKAQGFRATIVGGKVVLREGEHTGELPGRLLRAGFGGTAS